MVSNSQTLFLPLYYEEDSIVLIGDAVRQAKQACRMPSVKKFDQESEISSKTAYIFGHMFGGIGVLSGTKDKFFCIPLLIILQDGMKSIFKWKETTDNDELVRQESHIVQTIINAFEVTKTLGKSLLLLDKYFLSTNALIKLNELNAQNSHAMHLVTKAKSNCKAYKYPTQKKTMTPN